MLPAQPGQELPFADHFAPNDSWNMSTTPYRRWPPGLHRQDAVWTYEDGRPVEDPATLSRLNALAIPPAWQHVWASPDPDARVQARGIDSRGRIQYRYSEAATKEAAENRFAHMMHFAEHLPELRAAVEKELRRRPTSPDAPQVTALAVRFLDLGLFRVGTERYARENHTYGLTTLEPRHVRVHKAAVTFDFIGKEHLHQVHTVEDSHAAKVTTRLLEQAQADEGVFLFQTYATPREHIDSSSVNSYIHAVCGAASTAKVFRTWGATVIAASVSAGSSFPLGKKHKDPSLTAYDAAAYVLGNTPSMARHSYVHPSSPKLGARQDVREAVAEASERMGTDAAHRVFTDQQLQETVRRALEEEQGR